MTKIKGFCILKSKGEAGSPVEKLTLNKRYGFEKEYIDKIKEDGYSIITGTDPIRLKKSSFDLYFVEENANAGAVASSAPAASNVSKPATDKPQASAIKGPQGNAAAKASEPILKGDEGKSMAAATVIAFDISK